MLASINACMHLPVSLGLVENSIGMGMLLRVLCEHVPLLVLLLWLQKEGERGEFSLREMVFVVFFCFGKVVRNYLFASAKSMSEISKERGKFRVLRRKLPRCIDWNNNGVPRCIVTILSSRVS